MSPWTDQALFHTYSPQKDCITIVVGHDWYPIVPAVPHARDRPLISQGLHDGAVSHYWKGVPASLLREDPEHVMLFLNLYPDYRQPADPKTGKIKGSYAPWLAGFEAVVDAVSCTYRQVRIISWGTLTWDMLSRRVPGSHGGVMHNAEQKTGKVHRFVSGGRELPYLPLAHPCFDGNFKRPHHLRHVQEGFRQLEMSKG